MIDRQNWDNWGSHQLHIDSLGSSTGTRWGVVQVLNTVNRLFVKMKYPSLSGILLRNEGIFHFIERKYRRFPVVLEFAKVYED